MLKIPYGVRDFYALITEGYLYLDRTEHIRTMEALGKELLFLRPRRFGKSLWLSTLMNYYDIAKADAFEPLFDGLAIGRQPTPLHNQYLVMKWDFSNIESHGTIREIRTSLYNHINAHIKNFQLTYGARLHHPIEVNPDDALASFDSLLGVVRTASYKLYLFIDEYDNFANEVMMAPRRVISDESQQRYRDLIAGEGLLKTLFKNIKSAGAGEGLDRVFMTGVSPIVMNDITSGANTAKDVTWHPYLHDLCGFTETEVRALATPMLEACGASPAKIEEALEQMRLFYNGSRFVTRFPGQSIEETPKVYNPILTFYFLEEYRTFCLYPENMLDQNLAPDYHKLVYISSHPAGEALLLDAITEDKTISVATLNERFGMAAMLEAEKQRDRLATLLCYLGALTVSGTTPAGKVEMTIPNLVMRKLYAERILEMAFPKPATRDEGQSAADLLFTQGEIQPICNFVQNYYLPIYDNRDYQHFNELTLKTLFLALLHHNNLYIMDSETALQRSYADLIMLIRPEMRHFSVYDLLLEFKYVALDKLRINKKKVTGQELRKMTNAEIMALDEVKRKLNEAKTQLRNYQQILREKYGATLKLYTYAIIGIGVERLVWEKVVSEQ
ncbi:MAG: AAA family ATPase [Caldilineaceae bacterium]